MPYNNEVDVIEISGRTLRLMFEHSVHAYDANHPDPDGYFLQVSGVRIVYDVTHRPGQRVASLHVASSPGGPEAKYVQVTEAGTYEVAVTSFIATGGDGYEMLNSTTLLKHKNMGLLDKDLVTAYIKAGVIFLRACFESRRNRHYYCFSWHDGRKCSFSSQKIA